MPGNENPTLFIPPSPNPRKSATPDSASPVSAPPDSATSNSAWPFKASPLQRFGDYELIEEIARGGMGVVYKARHVNLNRVVALKMILSGQFASADDVRRFYQEAEAAANLDHSGIVPIYEIGEHEGHHFFSMKFIEGGSLAEQLPQLRESPRVAIQLLADVARAVHYAHQRGILHRDLKPANILLDETGRPLVSDLGLAKQIQSDSNLTQTGAIVGTPAYMPPEQAAAKKEITTAADIYSIGAMLYEVLTGKLPHQGETPVATLMQVLEADIVPPREIDRRIDRSLALICMKCLQRDPNQRYSSAAALAEDLESWLQGRLVSVRPPTFTSSIGELLRTNLRTAAGAAVIGLIAGICFAYCFSQVHSEEEIVANPPLKIYQALPAPIPLGRSLVFVKEAGINAGKGILSTLGLMASGICAGLFIAVFTRPKPGGEAFSLGLVSALFMSIALFTLDLGFGAVAASHEPTRRTVALLTDAALGTEKQAMAAQEQLLREYPGLDGMAEADRGNTLAYRVYYDGIYQAPAKMLLAMFMSVVLCMVPCITGTTFASKVMHEGNKRWQTAVLYFEFMLIVAFLAIYSFRQTLIAIDEIAPSTGLVDRWVRPGLVLSLLVFVTVALFRRRLTGRWRAVLYVLLLLFLVVKLPF